MTGFGLAPFGLDPFGIASPPHGRVYAALAPSVSKATLGADPRGFAKLAASQQGFAKLSPAAGFSTLQTD